MAEACRTYTNFYCRPANKPCIPPLYGHPLLAGYGKEGGAYATAYCRGCVKKAREGLPQAVRSEVSFAKFSVRWRGEHTVANGMLINVNPFSYALTKARVWELQIEIDKQKEKENEATS